MVAAERACSPGSSGLPRRFRSPPNEQRRAAQRASSARSVSRARPRLPVRGGVQVHDPAVGRAARRAPSAAPAASVSRCVRCSRDRRRGRGSRCAPPPLDLRRSGLRRGDRPPQREAEVARGQHVALLARPRPRPAAAATTAAPPAAARRPIPSPRARAANSFSSDRPGGLGAPSVVEVPGQCPHPTHFITGAELDADRLDLLLHRAAALKAAPLSSRALEGRTVALLFNKPSTRTRTSFEAGVFELGGHPMVLRADELQLTRGESVRDTALRPLAPRRGDRPAHRRRGRAQRARRACHCSGREHALAAAPPVPGARRPADHARGARLARGPRARPTSATATTSPARSAIVGALAGVEVRVAAPAGYQLPEGETPAVLFDDPAEAVAGADAVYTDVWVSHERLRGLRRRAPRGARARTRSTTRCSTRPRRTRSRCTACPPTRARRSPSPCSTATASGSGTRPRTAATRRRRCWSCSFRRRGQDG